MSRRAVGAWVLVLATALVAVGFTARPYARGLSLVVRAADLQGWIRAAAGWQTQPVDESDLAIPTRHGSIRARVYRPPRASETVLVITGVHALGIAEPRLIRIARELSASGVLVVTPELPGLKRYQLTSHSTDLIEDAGRWLSGQPELTPDGKLGLMGVSFSGGLSVVAAGRPALRDRLSYVFSLGGHADLPRVLQFLAQDGRHGGVPHDYGVAVLLLNTIADTHGLIPAEQVPALQHAIERFLWASHLAMVDQREAEREFQRARQLEGTLPEPASTLMRHVNDRDVKALGPKLLPYLPLLGRDPALSPERSPAPTAPVFLLHGRDDAVIPSSESTRLAEHLRGRTEVHLLLTGLVTHAEVDRSATVLDVWHLLRFWAKLLEER